MATKHKPSEVLQEQADPDTYREVDLSGAPVLRPPATLRPREKGPIVALGQKIQTMELGEDVRIDVAMESIAEIDEAMEKIAVNSDAYVAWVRDPNVTEEHIVALFARYVNDLGDSQRSAT